MRYSVLPVDAAVSRYSGQVDALGRTYKVSLKRRRPPGGGEPVVDLSSFRCDAELKSLMEAHRVMDLLRARLAQAHDVDAFMTELLDVLGRIGAAAPAPKPPPPEYYARLLSELDWGVLVSVDDTLTRLQLRAADAAGREHILAVTLPPDYPAGPPACAVDLPRPLELGWAPGRSSLADAIAQFRAALAPYVPLWDALDDLDAHTWVLEPERPTRAHVHRRVAVAPHCSVMLRLDPLAPRAVPEIRFLGAESVIGPLRQNLNRGLAAWDHTSLPRRNLQRALGVEFPSPATTRREEYSADCGICYAHRLPSARGDGGNAAGSCSGSGGDKANGSEDVGAAPDLFCDNACCRRPYHPQCLLEWLQGLPTSRVSFDTVFGRCPYCSSPISVATIR
ncbi:unnamed protein product [Phaeothamnion confervicola]